jgi:hypothetical protein
LATDMRKEKSSSPFPESHVPRAGGKTSLPRLPTSGV